MQMPKVHPPKVPGIKKAVSEGFGNFHGNLMNAGKEDNRSQKQDRMLAMKRRLAGSSFGG